MKIIFVITGIGYGHPIREYSIIKELLNKHPKTQIKILTYGTSYLFFKDHFDTIKIDGARLPDYEFDYKIRKIFLANILYPLKYLRNLNIVNKVIKEFKPDLVITDFEPSGIIASSTKKLRVLTIFNYNPNTFLDYKKENKINFTTNIQTSYINHYYKISKEVIIPTLFGPYRRENKFIFTNPMVRKLPNELPSELKIMEKLKLKKKPIIITIGGSNFGLSLLEQIINILPTFDEEFIIFGYNYSKEKIAKNITIYSFKPNFLEYLKVCKGIITLAGHNTLSELIVYKKPSLIFPINNHIEQILNAYEIEKRNCGIVKKLKSNDYDTLKKYIHDFIKRIPQLQETLNKISVEGTGAKEIVKIIDTFK